MNKKIVHDALILAAFTFVLGLILGGVNEITKKPIEKANRDTQEAAYREVFKDAYSFEENAEFDVAEAKKLLADSQYSKNELIDMQNAKDASENVIGYVMTVISHEGSQADITLSVGVQKDGTINGYSIISMNETPGLGVLIDEDAFKSQFNNKKADTFIVVKTAPTAENEIEAVTGATISSKAVANSINACLIYFHTVLQGGN